MPPKWLGFGKEEDDDIEVKSKGKSDNEISKEFTEKLGKIDGLETSVKNLESKTGILDRMSTYLDEQDALKTKARAAEAAEKAKRATEELDEDWINDPQKAIDKATQPLKLATINTHSLLLRKETFEDGKEFEFYHGDFKKEVDAYIDSLPPNAKVDPVSIKNCYYLVLGKKQGEIKEGKLKSRFADISTARAGESKGRESKDDMPMLTDAEKSAARKLGIPEDKYAKNLKELNIAI